MRREIRGAQLGPRLGDDLYSGQQLAQREHEVLENIAPVAVIGLQRGDAPHLGPMRRGADRSRDAVRRLDVGHPEGVLRVRHRLVEQEVGAAVVEQREHPQLLRHRPEGGGVAARNDAREELDVLRQLHAPQFLHVAVGPGGLVSEDRLDLALAEQAALRIDFLLGEDMSALARAAQKLGRAGKKRGVTDLDRPVGDVALRFDRSIRGPDSGGPKARRPQRRAELFQKAAALLQQFLVHDSSSCRTAMTVYSHGTILIGAFAALPSSTAASTSRFPPGFNCRRHLPSAPARTSPAATTAPSGATSR